MRIIIFIFILIAVAFFSYFRGNITISDLMNFIGVIFLGTIALFQEQFKRWWFAPKLRIDFRLESPYCSKTPLYLWMKPQDLPGEIRIDTEAYYFRVGVINFGKSQARLCEVFIAELQEYRENRWQEIEYFQQVNLKWDTGKSQDAYMHINPSPIRLLSDIGHIVKGNKNVPEHILNRFHLDYLYSIGGYQPQYLDANKKYRFKITVISENAKPVSRHFELFWTGVWKDTPEEMFKEITIQTV